MRKSEVLGIVNDLIELRRWKNPLDMVWSDNKIIFNLITGEGNIEEDSIIELCREKREWFLARVKKLKGSLSDFEKASISIYGAKEKVDMVYKGKRFEVEKVYGEAIDEERKMKKEIKRLKPFKFKI